MLAADSKDAGSINTPNCRFSDVDEILKPRILLKTSNMGETLMQVKDVLVVQIPGHACSIWGAVAPRHQTRQ